MARNLNSLVLVLLSVATLLHGSAAQTRHVVGDATGWTIPSGGAATYAAWAANQTFTVGDSLVFNFANGAHDVAKLTKAAFDACNGGSTIFILTNSPATVTLNETGEQYYICAFTGHCSAGQKLAINVTRKASTATSPAPAPQPRASSPSPRTSPVAAPAPQPATPPPAPVPAPAPAEAPATSTGSMTYTVGDTIGWTIPSGGAATYVTWAASKTFKVGDILVFNYQRSAHNVEEVTKQKFDSCNSASPLATYSNPPVRVTLNSSGPHYFICGIPGHCSAGQKLAINVTGSSGTATSPSSSATPPSTTSTTPSSPSPASDVTPPPQNSGAASLGSLGFFATLLSIAAAFFY